MTGKPKGFRTVLEKGICIDKVCMHLDTSTLKPSHLVCPRHHFNLSHKPLETLNLYVTVSISLKVDVGVWSEVIKPMTQIHDTVF